MFLIVGFLIGMNLMVRIVLGESRELRREGRASARGASPITPGDIGSIALRAAIFLLVPTLIGYALDELFGSSIAQLLG